MPTPAPTAPRPPPMPIPSPADPLDWANGSAEMMWMWRRGSSKSYSFGLVSGDGATDVNGSQGREDERLQRGHKPKLEQVDRDRERHREPPEERQPEDDRQRTGHEQDDHVAGEDVGPQPDGQREQAHDVRDHLERADREQHRSVDP